MNNFTETLTRVMNFASEQNWMDCGDYLIFGWDEYIKETGGQALDPIKQEGLNPGNLGRALFQIKQAWVSPSRGEALSVIGQLLSAEAIAGLPGHHTQSYCQSNRYCNTVSQRLNP